ncbi:RNA polymerase sigma factor SigZ [Aquimarina litoralis]|uniref:RNA polymerase sigma factor SigZ n=1 Tax=Aquimarina litoralis TaxID=584605 RepID=UPI001C59D415|nr:RNA polymerase sigma factor SigZ [Aquimarina litoralis]MBW1296295.1 RNA polymerase sigma factor SigZ [Aquimarina litoralis]
MQDKIETLWIDLNEELYHFILSKVRNEDLAKDILQDVFLKIHKGLPQLKQASKLTSWAYQITRNTIIDYYRKEKNADILSEDLNLKEDDHLDFEYAKLTDCINGKIENLSNQYQEAIVLTYLKDFSQKQFAKQVQLSYSGAKSRVQKARNILKKEILDCPNVESDSLGNIIDFQKKTD